MVAKRNSQGSIKLTKIYPLLPEEKGAKKDIPFDTLKTVGFKLDKSQAQELQAMLVGFIASEDDYVEITGHRADHYLRLSSRKEPSKKGSAPGRSRARIRKKVREVRAGVAERKRLVSKKAPAIELSDPRLEEEDKYYQSLERDKYRKLTYIRVHGALEAWLRETPPLRHLELRRRKDLGRYGPVLEVAGGTGERQALILEATLNEKWPEANERPIGWDNALISMPERKDPLCKLFPNALFVKVNESLSRAMVAPAQALYNTPAIGYRNDHEEDFNRNRFHWLNDPELVWYCKIADLPGLIVQRLPYEDRQCLHPNNAER